MANVKTLTRVKTVNGYAIFKSVAGEYYIRTNGKKVSFKTLKEADAFCKKLSYKPVRLAYAFAMCRTAMGMIKKESYIFTLVDDETENKKLIDKFAKEQEAQYVEVWYRNDNEWDTVIPYGIFSYVENITSATFDKLVK